MKKNKILTKEELTNLLLCVLIVCGISACISIFWQGLELLIYKEIQHRMVDNIIAIILTISLSINLKYLIESCLKKED